MKWVKSRIDFLNEAKIKDLVLPIQSKQISKNWGSKFLDYEEVHPTDKIKQGKWLLSEKDKNEALSIFFGCDIDNVFKIFKKMPKKFAKCLTESFDKESFKDEESKEKYSIIFQNFDANEPTIDQLSCFREKVFRRLLVAETKSDFYIKRNDDGSPIKDKDGKIIKNPKKAGDPIYDKNLVDIKGFCDSYNRCYKDKIDTNVFFYNQDISNLIEYSSLNKNINYKYDFKIFEKDLYLYIKHNPKDILNISISKFYHSCQHLYTGKFRDSIISNVFDPNSIPAYLIFETPIFNDKDKLSDFLPLSRLIIRSLNINPDEETILYFDNTYPYIMEDFLTKTIEKYSGNKNSSFSSHSINKYTFTPDLKEGDLNYKIPYMDNLEIERKKLIGVNTKFLYIHSDFDWSEYIIHPKSNLKEIIIETENIPTVLKDDKINVEKLRFRNLKISSFNPFKDFLNKKLSFEKCQINKNLFDYPIKGLKKIEFISCDYVDYLNLSNILDLEELSLLYTVDYLKDIKKIIENLDLKKLTISSDLYSSKKQKEYFNSLKNKIKIEVIGPKI